ncbi:MDR family MFS transporter [Gordonibacter sp. 28C]|uniref:MDR family MFS transporter n=1 Tax=Gordonibacter sp. 28C TaxID=2078569 RepID=UPI001F5430EE|nr:MDR family MFS transporter [Gordonibacter sp. 28C]
MKAEQPVAAQQHKATRKELTIIGVVLAGAFLAILNQTVLSPALPKLMETFDITAGTAQWVTSIYLLVNGIMVPISGFLIDRFPTRKLFFASMIAFIAGTALCAVAPSFPVLIVGRVLQAAGAGVQLPLVAVVPMLIFPPEKRGTAMGMSGIVMSCAPAAGPVVAGGIIDAMGWRAMFGAMLPLAVIVLAVSFFLLANVGELKRPHLDVPSILLSTVAFGGLLYGFSSASTLGWGSPLVVLPIIVGVAALVWFVRRQLHIDEPLLQLRVLKRPTFAYSAVIVTVINSALSVGSVILPIYLQNVLGLTAFETGILMTPGAVCTIFLSPVSGMLFDRFGPRVIAVVGLTGLFGSMLALAFVGSTTAIWYLVCAYVVQSSGLTLANMPITTWGINSLENDQIAHGNAISNTGRQVGGAISTALIVTIMTMVTAANADAGPVQSTAAGIDVAYGVSAAIAAVALVLAVLKVRNRRKPEQRGAASIELVPDSTVADDEVAARLAESTPVPKTARAGETARGAQPPVAHETPEGAAL